MKHIRIPLIIVGVLSQLFLYYYISVEVFHWIPALGNFEEVIYISEETYDEIHTETMNGSLANPPALYYQGHVIDGWYLSRFYDADSKWNFNSDTIEGTTVLYARWVEEEHTIRLFTDSQTIYKIQVEPHGVRIELPIPTRDNYVFGGWYFEESYHNQVYILDVYRDVDIYAKWIPVD